MNCKQNIVIYYCQWKYRTIFWPRVGIVFDSVKIKALQPFKKSYQGSMKYKKSLSSINWEGSKYLEGGGGGGGKISCDILTPGSSWDSFW